MTARRRVAAGMLLLGSSALVLLAPSAASAQAWVPPKGEGYLTLSFQSLDADKFFFSDASDRRPVDHQLGGRTLVIDGDFGITDKLAVTASAAYVDGRFTEGDNPNVESPHHGLPTDDGSWHGSWQDARVSLRFMQSVGAWVLTPAAAVVVPLQDYPTLGHAAVGRGLNELQLEFDAGRLIDLSGRPAYVQGGYRYTFAESIEGVSPDRSNLFLELGYLAHRRLTLRGFADWRDSHGGIENPQDIIRPDEDDSNFHLHDRLAAARWLRLGVGASTPVAPGVDLFVSVAKTVDGENAPDSMTFSVGTTWGFRAPGYGRAKIRFPGSGDGPR